MSVARPLSISGDKIVDGAGTPVLLRGVGLGGWMTMENFITGYPGTESQQRRALTRVLGGWCSTGVLQAVVIGSKPVSGSHGWL
jgi:hypothetical protein